MAVTILILISSFTFDDNIGQTFSIYIISIAGAESVIGLSILVAYYRLFSNFFIIYCLSYSTSYAYVTKLFNYCQFPRFPRHANKAPTKERACVRNNYNKNNKFLKTLNIVRSYCVTSSVCKVNNKDVNRLTLVKPLNPWFITGIFDAESSFVVVILKKF